MHLPAISEYILSHDIMNRLHKISSYHFYSCNEYLLLSKQFFPPSQNYSLRFQLI